MLIGFVKALLPTVYIAVTDIVPLTTVPYQRNYQFVEIRRKPIVGFFTTISSNNSFQGYGYLMTRLIIPAHQNEDRPCG